MTNYFKPFFFEAVVTVNLTVMLVLATMFISVSENLPKTSYIKMVDVWLIFNLMIPFFEVKKSKINMFLTSKMFLRTLIVKDKEKNLRSNVLHLHICILTTLTTTNTKINIFCISKVILHTFIDSLRAEEDREINHHGKSVKVLLFILRFYLKAIIRVKTTSIQNLLICSISLFSGWRPPRFQSECPGRFLFWLQSINQRVLSICNVSFLSNL